MAAAVVRPDDFIDRAIDIQCGKGKLGLTNPLVPVSGLAPKEAHRLATRKITTEIHGAAQHLRQVHRKTGGDVCRVQGGENRALDHRLAGESHQFGIRVQHAGGKLFAEDRLYPDTVFDGELYTTRVVVRCGNHRNDVTRTQTAQIVFRANRQGDFGAIRSIQPRIGKDRIKRLAGRNLPRPGDQRGLDRWQGGISGGNGQERPGSELECDIRLGECRADRIGFGNPRRRKRIGSPEGRFSNRRGHRFFGQNARDGDGGHRKCACDRNGRQDSSYLHVAPSTSSVSARWIFGTANSLCS